MSSVVHGLALLVAAALAPRVPGTVVIPGSPEPPSDVRVKAAFPGLTLARPVYLTHPHDGSDRIVVLEQDGRVRVFDNRSDVVRSDVALDISKKVLRNHNEEGLLGIAFHPKGQTNGQVFVMYSAPPRKHVLARFTMDAARKVIRPDSEQILVEVEKPFGNHNGGMVEFGPDGFLYFSFGDGGSRADPHKNAQNTGSWLGKIHRIDVDRTDGGRPYAIPADNPFLPLARTAGARPEIYALGLRNAWRFSFDRATRIMFAGDVGQNAWEEIDVIKKGGNYGWNVWEGNHRFAEGQGQPEVPFEAPILEYPQHVGRSITGGYVYRGKKVPSLVGVYLYADFETGTIWGLRYDGQTVTDNRVLGHAGQISSFGEDRDGEVYFTTLDGGIHTFETRPASPPPAVAFPNKLSQTGLFLPDGKPHPSLRAYTVASPLWSDGADKRRWAMVPGLEKIAIGKNGRFEYPRGTIFVKEFAFGKRKLETRLFMRAADGWVGYTYVWDDEQRDATLIDGRVERQIGKKKWTFPGRGDCMSCHTQVGGYVLGWKPRQLGSQLTDLVAAGYFAEPGPVVAPAFDQNDARGYLDANCANCHQSGGPGNAPIDLRWNVPLDRMKSIGVAAMLGDLGVPGAAIVAPGKPQQSVLYLRMKDTGAHGMPPLAHNLADARGLGLVSKWIASVTAPGERKTIAVGTRPESVTRGFGGRHFVTIMNGKADGDGVVKVIDGAEVRDFATGLDEPKGICFTGKFLITTDVKRVWKIDEKGEKSLLADAPAFPLPASYLNDAACSADGKSVYVTDMGAYEKMRDANGTLWPLDSAEGRALPALGRVYRIGLDGKVTLVQDASADNPCPNGVAIAAGDGGGDRLLVSEFFKGNILDSRGGKLRIIASGYRGADGIAQTRNGDIYISSWTQGKVWRLDRNGQNEVVIMDGLQAAADLFVDETTRQLVQPDMKAGTVTFVPLR